MKNLDFELEVAIVISKEGKNISCNEADDYIAGLMIMNDFSARHLQMQEMKLNLGPAKGKDFATSIGPIIVTLPKVMLNAGKKPKTGCGLLRNRCSPPTTLRSPATHCPEFVSNQPHSFANILLHLIVL